MFQKQGQEGISYPCYYKGFSKHQHALTHWKHTTLKLGGSAINTAKYINSFFLKIRKAHQRECSSEGIMVMTIMFLKNTRFPASSFLLLLESSDINLHLQAIAHRQHTTGMHVCVPVRFNGKSCGLLLQNTMSNLIIKSMCSPADRYSS